MLLDNPMMPDAVGAGLLATAEQAGNRHQRASTRTCSAPASSTASAYGVPMGSNALGLYYNKEILDAAGVDPASDQGLGTR